MPTPDHCSSTCLAARRGIKLNDCIPDDKVPPEEPSILRVTADPDRLSQVIDNLLDNALRYLPDHATFALK
ncbi:MAG TPA: hypothetical protein VFS61_03140 [Anaerolineales bacterium]|nr:hypothetical protein [Anaerolineales bacterium]